MKKVKDIMTKNPAYCLTKSKLKDAAALMIKHDCGEIPVISGDDYRIVGVITDRDICCRTVGKGLNPLTMKVSDVMTSPAITVGINTPVEECCKVMEDNQIRRVPVVDDFGKICGIVSTCDIARKEEPLIAEVMQEISQPKNHNVG